MPVYRSLRLIRTTNLHLYSSKLRASLQIYTLNLYNQLLLILKQALCQFTDLYAWFVQPTSTYTQASFVLVYRSLRLICTTNLHLYSSKLRASLQIYTLNLYNQLLLILKQALCQFTDLYAWFVQPTSTYTQASFVLVYRSLRLICTTNLHLYSSKLRASLQIYTLNLYNQLPLILKQALCQFTDLYD